MKIHKSEIVPKLKQLKAFLPTKNIIPAAEGVLFHKNMLIANSLELAISTPVNSDSGESFIITPSAIDFIMNVPNDEITIEVKNEKLYVKCGKARASFGFLSPDGFPTKELYDLEETEADFECDAEEFMQEISRVIFACDKTENPARPIYSAVKFQTRKGILNMIASDTQRVAWNKMRCAADIDISILRRDLQKILSLGLSGKLKIFITDNKKLAFKTDRYSIYSNTISGNYMDFPKLFSKAESNCLKLEIETEPFLEALKRAAVCGKSEPVKLTFAPESLTIELNAAISEFSEEVPVLNSELEGPVIIGFNAVFLIEALKATESKSVTIGISHSTDPLLMRSDTLEQMVLPVRLGH